jgi:hypothetical protein
MGSSILFQNFSIQRMMDLKRRKFQIKCWKCQYPIKYIWVNKYFVKLVDFALL